ncbi:MAG TPA: MoxR family ATPase [Rhodocyclaceae bacterium]|nr:MoxR family ATPase [Rhodocyclaceae bacterium]
MDNMTKGFRFIGTGRGADLDARLSDINPWGGSLGPWRPGEGRPAVEDETAREHPAGYRAGSDLVDAVNTALILGKPLLVTGNPGTGKTQLAERVAWEFNLGPVLRFEAQSLSEANDLFYRFDLVGHVAASHTARPAAAGDPPSADARQFIDFGVLGKAILRTDPGNPNHADLFGLAFPEPTVARNASPSVVLIDEIDKASRDFPNDLLNGIERLEFSLKELRNRPVRVADDPGMKPIVVVTSNSERELPAPFLRRCVYCHIPDPGRMILARGS